MTFKQQQQNDLKNVFLNSDEFSEDAVHGSDIYPGIFDREYAEGEFEGSGGQAMQTVFTVPEADGEILESLSSFKIKDLSFTVRWSEPSDSAGMVKLVLKRV